MNTFAMMVNEQPLLTLGSALLVLFSALAAFDGIGLHLLKFRLHARRESYNEHLWHTASAVLFVPVVAWMFDPQAGGVTLWIAVAALAVTHVVELFDARAERESRRSLGGLGRGEFAIHIGAVATRTGAVAALLFARPLHAWSLAFEPSSASSANVLHMIQPVLLWGTVGMALVHIALAVAYCPSCTSQRVCGAAA